MLDFRNPYEIEITTNTAYSFVQSTFQIINCYTVTTGLYSSQILKFVAGCAFVAMI